MASLVDVFARVRPDTSRFEPELRSKLGRVDAERSGKEMGRKFGRGMVSAVGRAAVGIGAAFASVRVAGFLKDSIAAASDLNETVSKTQQVFGPAAAAVIKYSRTSATALGQSQQQALDAAATFGVFGKAAGLQGPRLATFSTRLTTLASDMASFSNTTPQEAIDALGAALRGESEPIRRYGVLLDDASLKAEGMRLGLVKATGDTGKIAIAQGRAMLAQKAYNAAVKEHGKNSTEAQRAGLALKAAQGTLAKATQGTIPPLTQQQKVLAAQSLIFKQLGTSGAVGDFQRTQAGLANQQRIMASQFADLKVKIGSVFLPVVLAAAVQINQKLLPALSNFTDKHGPKMRDILVDITEKAGPFIKNILAKAGPYFKSLADGSSDASPQLSSIADSLKKLGPAFKEMQERLPSINDLLKVGAVVLKFFADHTSLLTKLMPALVAGFIAFKVAQLAANLAQAVAVPTKIAEVVVNRQLIKSNRELIASRNGLTVATIRGTAATAGSTGAQQAGILATIRQRVATIASTVAQKAARAATLIWTGAQWLLNAALTANPIGIVVVAIAALVAGIVIAYKKSETFRNIVQGVWRVVQGAISIAWNYYYKPILTALWNILKTVWDRANVFRDVLTGAWRLVGSVLTGTWNNVIRPVFSGIVSLWFAVAGSIVNGAARAFGWVPGLGDKLRGAARAFNTFRDQVNRALNGVTSKTVTVSASFVASRSKKGHALPLGLASGGMVREGSTPTADDVPAWLSRGEFVVNAAATARHEQLLHQINAGKYASGGLVPRVRLPSGRQIDNASEYGFVQFARANAGAIADALRPLIAQGPVGPGGWAFPLPRGSYAVGVPVGGYPGHTGQDFPAPRGTKVYAPFAGNFTPVRLGNRSYGNYANITSGPWRSIQAHLLGFARSAGHVLAGELVGYVDSTGNSTGNHLHQEFRKNGRVVNPRSVLKYDSGGWLMPGYTLAYNGTGRPERVTPAGGGTTIVVNAPHYVGDKNDLVRALDQLKRDRRI